MSKGKLFTAEQAYLQGRSDVRAAQECVEFVSQYGTPTEAQRDEIVRLVLQMRYAGHRAEGKLA